MDQDPFTAARAELFSISDEKDAGVSTEEIKALVNDAIGAHVHPVLASALENPSQATVREIQPSIELLMLALRIAGGADSISRAFKQLRELIAKSVPGRPRHHFLDMIFSIGGHYTTGLCSDQLTALLRESEPVALLTLYRGFFVPIIIAYSVFKSGDLPEYTFKTKFIVDISSVNAVARVKDAAARLTRPSDRAELEMMAVLAAHAYRQFNTTEVALAELARQPEEEKAIFKSGWLEPHTDGSTGRTDAMCEATASMCADFSLDPVLQFRWVPISPGSHYSRREKYYGLHVGYSVYDSTSLVRTIASTYAPEFALAQASAP